MGFFIKKMVALVIMPLSSAAILMTIGIALLFTRRFKAWGKGLLIFGLAYLLIFSWAPVGTVLLRPIEQTYQPIEIEDSKKLDYIIVLGTQAYDDAALPIRFQLSSSAFARISEGVRLAKLNPSARLLVTGYAGSNRRAIADIYADYAKSQGINPDRIQAFTKVRDTREEAQAVQALVVDQTIALVTSASHLPRAVEIFKQKGLVVIPAPTFYLARQPSGHYIGASALLLSERAIYEYVAMAWVKVTK